MESSNLQRTDSRGVLNWKKGSKDADSGTPTSLGGNLGLRQSVTRRSTDGGFGGASRKCKLDGEFFFVYFEEDEKELVVVLKYPPSFHIL